MQSWVRPKSKKGKGQKRRGRRQKEEDHGNK